MAVFCLFVSLRMNSEMSEVTFVFIDATRMIDGFESDTLFMNIYNYWCFCRHLLWRHLWDKKAMLELKKNIIKKWPKNDFCNVNLFLELMSANNEEIDPTVYFWKSEDYFERLMILKPKFDKMVCKRHLNVVGKKRQCIR